MSTTITTTLTNNRTERGRERTFLQGIESIVKHVASFKSQLWFPELEIIHFDSKKCVQHRPAILVCKVVLLNLS